MSTAYTEPGTLADVGFLKPGDLLWLNKDGCAVFSRPNFSDITNGWDAYDGPYPTQGSPFIFTGNVVRYVIPDAKYPDGKYITPYIEVLSSQKRVVWVATFALSTTLETRRRRPKRRL